MVWFVMWLTGGGQISCLFLCQNCHIFYSPLAEVFTFGEASTFFCEVFYLSLDFCGGRRRCRLHAWTL